MDIYFNELSLEDRKALEYDNVSEIAKIYKELGKHKIKSCRIDDASYISLLKLIENMPNCGNAKNFYFAFFHRPYETQEVLEREDEYYSHQYTFEGKACYGLALGYVMDSISLSLEGQNWNDPIVVIKMDDSDVEVRHISILEHIRWHKKWLEDQEEIDLVERSEKAIVRNENFRDDHGKDELMAFSKRLIRNKYVTEVVNSLPFHPNRRRFISAIKANGINEIVLPWTDEGSGIAIKTTGRSYRETEKIASILEKEFGVTIHGKIMYK